VLNAFRLPTVLLLLLLPSSLRRRDAATGEVRIGIFTTRDVGVNEELTYDYMFEHYGLSGMAQGFKCQCGAKNCRWEHAQQDVCMPEENRICRSSAALLELGKLSFGKVVLLCRLMPTIFRHCAACMCV
jgi:hypothetical protein